MCFTCQDIEIFFFSYNTAIRRKLKEAEMILSTAVIFFFSLPQVHTWHVLPSLSLKLPRPQSLDGQSHWSLAFQRFHVLTTFMIPEDKMCFLHAETKFSSPPLSQSFFTLMCGLSPVLYTKDFSVALIWGLWDSFGVSKLTSWEVDSSFS